MLLRNSRSCLTRNERNCFLRLIPNGQQVQSSASIIDDAQRIRLDEPGELIARHSCFAKIRIEGWWAAIAAPSIVSAEVSAVYVIQPHSRGVLFQVGEEL